jgi:predicted  nucleic acid-binding Zn-ribbon protein
MTLRTALCCFVLFACVSSVFGDKTRTKYTQYSQYNEENVPQMASNNLYDYLEGSQQQQEAPRFREDPATITPTTADGTQATPTADQVLPPEPAAATAPGPVTDALIVPPTSKNNVIIGSGNTPQPGPMPVRIPSQEEQQQIQAQQAEEADPEMVKLDSALEAVKEDIMTNSKKIADEKKWVKAVTKITASYEEKVKRVEEHIIVLRKDQKSLFQKKKQIENLKLQRRLEAKLRDANEELTALQNSLKSVQVKNEELNKSHMDLRATIITIENQLAKLKGEDAKLKEGEGEEVKSEVQSTLDAEGLAVGDGDQGATDSESTEEDSP